MIAAATTPHVKRIWRQVNAEDRLGELQPACSTMPAMTIAPPRMAGIEASGNVPLPQADTRKPPTPQKLKNEKTNVMAPPITITSSATEMCFLIPAQTVAPGGP